MWHFPREGTLENLWVCGGRSGHLWILPCLPSLEVGEGWGKAAFSLRCDIGSMAIWSPGWGTRSGLSWAPQGHSLAMTTKLRRSTHIGPRVTGASGILLWHGKCSGLSSALSNVTLGNDVTSWASDLFVEGLAG